MGKSVTIDYSMKEYCKEHWFSFKAWKVWSTHPKWSIDNDTSSEASATSSAVFQGQPDVSKAGDGEDEGTKYGGTGRSTSASTKELSPMGKHNAKMIRQEEMRTQAVRSIAESSKRKSDSLEELNETAVFSRPEASGIHETAQFFAEVRHNYLTQSPEKARMDTEQEASATNPPTSTVSGRSAEVPQVQSTFGSIYSSIFPSLCLSKPSA